MPHDVAGTEKILSFIAGQISPDTYVNIMAQYRPCGQAQNYPEINRRITRKEYETALLIARKVGLRRLD
jgi:putative pyruvate formate lyase activating enzyme